MRARDIPFVRRIRIVAFICVLGTLSLTCAGNLFAGKWDESVSSDMQRAYGSGQCQKLKPRGNWLVTLDVPEYMTPALRSALTNELTCITSGLCRVRFAGDDDAIQPFENSLYVTFTGSGLWTPYLGTYDDTWEFEFSDCGTPVEGFVDVWTLDRSEIRVRGECANEGIGYGIVGRKALTTRRVQKGVEAISQGIAESYGTVVQRQNRPCANEG